MSDRIGRAARILGHGTGFLVFGAWSCALAFVAFPLMRRLSRAGGDDLELRCQRMVGRCFRVYLWVIRLLDVAEVRVEGAERLREPGAHLLVANHPTLIDVIVIGSLVDQLDCVVKSAAWSNPFMRGVVRATGYIANDDGLAMLEEGAARLQRGRSLLLFPEGTRSPRDGLHPFQRGAAHLALRTGLPILPIVIRVEPRGLMKGQKWWDVPAGRMRYRVEVGEPLHAKEFAVADEPRARTARRATAALRDFYLERLHSKACEAEHAGPG